MRLLTAGLQVRVLLAERFDSRLTFLEQRGGQASRPSQDGTSLFWGRESLRAPLDSQLFDSRHKTEGPFLCKNRSLLR